MILFLWGKLPRSGPVDRGNSVIIVPRSQIWEANCLFSGGVKNIQPGSKDSNGSAAVPDCFLVGNSVDAPGQSADNGQSRQVQITRNGLGDGLAVCCVAPGTYNGDCIFPGLQRLPGTIQQNGRVIDFF